MGFLHLPLPVLHVPGLHTSYARTPVEVGQAGMRISCHPMQEPASISPYPPDPSLCLAEEEVGIHHCLWSVRPVPYRGARELLYRSISLSHSQMLLNISISTRGSGADHPPAHTADVSSPLPAGTWARSRHSLQTETWTAARSVRAATVS